ncbi:MAG: protoporphyrinogen oxidase [Myxococcales bacterium]|nr:protoporphyrinogen oxidase [Myxococcales bacterium]HQY62226.1 protoporphyrinogen oxidase [Polyangiaceae bacterium]
MSRRTRVVVIGGGITGLTTAYALEHLAPEAEVVLVEASPRLGGNIVTDVHNGFLIDYGPDSWVAAKPHATDLARELGLGDELIETIPANRKVYIAHNGALHSMPEGVLLGVPTEAYPIAVSELFTWDAKLRMGLELVVPPRAWHDGEDETVGAFLERRFGEQLTERLAGPLLGGIFAGDAYQISVRAAFPQLVAAEKTHGSLIRAMRAQKAARTAKSPERPAPRDEDPEHDRRRPRSSREKRDARDAAPPSRRPAGPSAFLSLKRGMGDLVVNLAHRVKGEVRLGARVESVSAAPVDRGGPGRRYRVALRDEVLEADHVVFTGPAHAARRALAPLDDTLPALLGEFDYASTATVFLAFKRSDVDHPLDASGYIVPRSAGRAALACTWVGSKWDHRVPGGQALVRLFFSGQHAGREVTDEALADLARRELAAFVPLRGMAQFARIHRYGMASPQPRLGHLARLARVERALSAHPGVYLAGNGYDGIGIPECIRQAREVARAIADASAGRATREREART